ncbi:MAG: hypothetical protein JW719_12765 [Pirellulales bacterium]|nr:hypothetical protein [Pirellulales bacterium]
MSTELAIRRAIDDEHVRLLSIFYYVLGALNALWAFFPLIYVFFGLFFVAIFPTVPHNKDAAPMAFFGLFFIVIGLFGFVVCVAFAALKIYAGYCLAQRKNRVFCYVVAALSCLYMPFGTILGVFTFLVLARPNVAAQFHRAAAELVE